MGRHFSGINVHETQGKAEEYVMVALCVRDDGWLSYARGVNNTLKDFESLKTREG